MAATDVTYLFFQRDGSGTVDNGPLSPTVKTARVIQHQVTGRGRLRAGSMPPPSLRASSQPPGARSGSAAPPELSGSSVIHHVTHVARPVSPGGVIKHRSPTTTVVRGVRGDGTTGVISAVPRSSHAAARRRSSISVIPGTTATATWRATNNHQPIFRAEAFIKSVSGDKRTADALKPAVTTTSVTRQRTSSISSPVPVPASSSSPAYRRRSSVSVVVVGPAESRHRTAVTRSVSSSLPLPVRSTSPVRRGSPVRSGSPIRRGSPVPYSRRHLPAAESVAVTDIKSHVSPSDVPSPAAVQAIFDKQLSKSSLKDLRNRADAARDRLSRHRILIDRYLPTHMYLGPTESVNDIVENKVSELFNRMPHLDPNRSRDIDAEVHEVRASPITAVAPYQPLKPIPRVQLPPLHVETPVFTPKISDVRKRARSVLCKVKGDPNYFNI